MTQIAHRQIRKAAHKGFLASLCLPKEPLKAHHHIVAGFNPDIVTKIAVMLGSDTTVVCKVTGIDRTTFSRKVKASHLLSQDQSSRVYWLAQVLDAASSLNDGDMEKTMRWLRKPAWGLGNKAPIDLLTTAAGAQAVIDLVGQIEHGVAV